MAQSHSSERVVASCICMYSSAIQKYTVPSFKYIYLHLTCTLTLRMQKWVHNCQLFPLDDTIHTCALLHIIVMHSVILITALKKGICQCSVYCYKGQCIFVCGYKMTLEFYAYLNVH